MDAVDQRRPGETAPLGAWPFRLVVVLALAAGLVERAWYLFHVPLNSDEAVVGLSARAIDAGHVVTFYPGQVYGGVEPYVTAALFSVFGASAAAVKLTAVLLSAVASVLVWRVARRLVHDPVLAALAGALTWVAPLAVVLNSTVERGFRGVTMVCGLGCLLLALRALDGRDDYGEFVAFGVLAGIGWWSSPEIAYLLLPAAILMGAALVQCHRRRLRWWWAAIAVAGGAVVGALPWLWANLHSGFASLHPNDFAGSRALGNGGFGTRLGVFFEHVLPGQLNLAAPGRPHGLFAGTAGTVLAVVVYAMVIGAIVLCVLRGGRILAVVAALVAFPFLYALQPGTWYWQDGRYGVFMVPLVALVLVVGAEEAVTLVRRFRERGAVRSASRGMVRLALVAIVITTTVFSVVALHLSLQGLDPRPGVGLRSGWVNTETPTQDAVRRLEAAGVHHAYADYWVAYVLDFMSGNRLEVTTVATDPRKPIPGVSSPAGVPRAWLFVPPAEYPVGYWQFGETLGIDGPLGLPESSFEQRLDAMHVRYRVIDAGLLQAVIPAETVWPTAVGLGAPVI
jgi:hypothetical protein